MKKQNLGQKIYLIVQNPFHSIENYKNSRTFEKFKNTKVKSIVFQEHFKEFKDEWPHCIRCANLTKHVNYKHRKKILAKQQTLCLKKYLYAATNLNSIL